MAPALTQKSENEPDDETDQLEVLKHAKEVGLTGFHTTRSKNYLAIGDAPEAFRKQALEICEKLLSAYFAHFQEFKRLALKPITRRLAVVALANPKSYTTFTGMEAAPGVGGSYDRDTNWLVMFDNRTQDRLNQDVAKQANLVSLVHEATHQLSFNTGMLNRDGDVPTCLSEGFGTYAETWLPTRMGKLGQDNRGRRQGFEVAHRARVAWIPIAKLLEDDRVFEGGGGNDAALQLAYAESWLLVYEQMKPLHVSKFRRYLETIRERRDAANRLADAREHLGDLDKLDQSLRVAAAWAILG